MPSPFFCFWDFALPYYFALLLALDLDLDRCCKLVLSFPLLLSYYLFQTPFTRTISFYSRWRSRSQLRASSTELGREALKRIRIASTGKKSRKSFSTQRSVIIFELWGYGISKLIDQYPARYRSSNALVYVTGIKPAVYFVAMTISSLLPGLCTIHSPRQVSDSSAW